MGGSAAGTCTWTGNEVSDLPTQAWQEFAEPHLAAARPSAAEPRQHAWCQVAALANEWFTAGELPSVLRRSRQIQLAKPGATAGDITMVSKLRPISIQSVIWRVIASAIATRASAAAWVSSKIPHHTYGGVKHRDALQAALTLSALETEQRHCC